MDDQSIDSSNISSEEIAKTKKNKYQGLLNFAAEIKAEEQKSGSKTQTTGFTLKFPNFLKVFNKMSLSPGKKRKIQHLEEEAKKNHIDLNKLVVMHKKDPLLNSMPKVFRENVDEDPLEKKREEFMLKFPPRRLHRRNTYHHKYKILPILDSNPKKRKLMKSKTLFVEDEENVDEKKAQNYPNKTLNYIEPVPEKPALFKRKLSDKENIDSKDKLQFINELRNQMMSENNETLNEILNKIEQSITNEIKRGHVLLSPLKTPSKIPMMKHIGPWEELWEDKMKTIQEKSPYGHFPSYRLRSLIVKGGDDLRQELVAMQIIIKFQEIFKQSCLSLYLRPYEIVVTSANSGILEFVPNTISLDGLKKKYPGMSLMKIYSQIFLYDFEEAQKNFIESLAAYSLVCYFIQIKDRLNFKFFFYFILS